MNAITRLGDGFDVRNHDGITAALGKRRCQLSLIQRREQVIERCVIQPCGAIRLIE